MLGTLTVAAATAKTLADGVKVIKNAQSWWMDATKLDEFRQLLEKNLQAFGLDTVISEMTQDLTSQHAAKLSKTVKRAVQSADEFHQWSELQQEFYVVYSALHWQLFHAPLATTPERYQAYATSLQTLSDSLLKTTKPLTDSDYDTQLRQIDAASLLSNKIIFRRLSPDLQKQVAKLTIKALWLTKEERSISRFGEERLPNIAYLKLNAAELLRDTNKVNILAIFDVALEEMAETNRSLRDLKFSATSTPQTLNPMALASQADRILDMYAAADADLANDDVSSWLALAQTKLRLLRLRPKISELKSMSSAARSAAAPAFREQLNVMQNGLVFETVDSLPLRFEMALAQLNLCRGFLAIGDIDAAVLAVSDMAKAGAFSYAFVRESWDFSTALSSILAEDLRKLTPRLPSRAAEQSIRRLQVGAELLLREPLFAAPAPNLPKDFDLRAAQTDFMEKREILTAELATAAQRLSAPPVTKRVRTL